MGRNFSFSNNIQFPKFKTAVAGFYQNYNSNFLSFKKSVVEISEIEMFIFNFSNYSILFSIRVHFKSFVLARTSFLLFTLNYTFVKINSGFFLCRTKRYWSLCGAGRLSFCSLNFCENKFIFWGQTNQIIQIQWYWIEFIVWFSHTFTQYIKILGCCSNILWRKNSQPQHASMSDLAVTGLIHPCYEWLLPDSTLTYMCTLFPHYDASLWDKGQMLNVFVRRVFKNLIFLCSL